MAGLPSKVEAAWLASIATSRLHGVSTPMQQEISFVTAYPCSKQSYEHKQDGAPDHNKLAHSVPRLQSGLLLALRVNSITYPWVRFLRLW